MQHKIEICKRSNFVELICLTLSSIKIDYRPVKLVSFHRRQKYGINDFVNTLDIILNNYANNPIIIIGDSNIDLYHSANVTDFLTDREAEHALIMFSEKIILIQWSVVYQITTLFRVSLKQM